MNIDRFKFKYLSQIEGGKLDYVKLMKEILDFKKSRWKNILKFKQAYLKIDELIKEVEKIDVSKVKIKKDGKIKYPDSIDHITFSAMMDIQMLSNNANEKTVLELIGDVVAIACFSSNVKGNYDNESPLYINFRQTIDNAPVLEILGLYNHIDKQLEESNKIWEKRFFEVNIEDKDFVMAGGNILNNFNVINTIKTICSDFNLSYDEAWQLPYGVTQTNSLARATQGFIQHRMTEIKESRMKKSRKIS